MSPQLNESEIAAPPNAKSWGLGIVGAAIGGAVGWFIFSLLFNEGFYALALPGAMLGYGFGMLSRMRSVAGGVVCAVAAAVLMFMCEWHHRAWTADESLGYFIRNVHELSTATFLMFFLGVAMAFWFGKGS